MNTQPGSSTRRLDLDWLQVIAVLTVFLSTSVRFFDANDWSVKNGAHYTELDGLVPLLASWMMPILFVISGASLFYALSKGGFGKFARDRGLRLLIPLGVGIFTHAILQVYLERMSYGQFDGTFWEFLPQYFDGLYGFGGNFAWSGLHLWYLLVLFLYSLLLYPLFRWLIGGGHRALSATGEFLAKPGAVYLLALPVMLLISVLNPAELLGRRDFGGWSPLPYLLFLVYGFILISSARLQQSILRLRWISLAGVIVASVAVLLLSGPTEPQYGTLAFVAVNATYALCGWFWTLMLFGFGMRHLTTPNRFLRYAGEAVLPFYVMHQTVVLTTGYIVVQMAIPDLLKWAFIVAVSLCFILGTYEVLIRRHNVMRFLFGMRWLRRETPALARPVPAASGR